MLHTIVILLNSLACQRCARRCSLCLRQHIRSTSCCGWVNDCQNILTAYHKDISTGRVVERLARSSWLQKADLNFTRVWHCFRNVCEPPSMIINSSYISNVSRDIHNVIRRAAAAHKHTFDALFFVCCKISDLKLDSGYRTKTVKAMRICNCSC